MSAKQVTKKVEVESDEEKIEKVDTPIDSSSAKKRLTITPKQKKIGVGVVLCCLLLGIGFVGGVAYQKNDDDSNYRPKGRMRLNSGSDFDTDSQRMPRGRMMPDLDDTSVTN